MKDIEISPLDWIFMQKQIFPDNAFRLKNSKSNFNSKFAGQKNELKEHFLRKKKKKGGFIYATLDWINKGTSGRKIIL